MRAPWIVLIAAALMAAAPAPAQQRPVTVVAHRGLSAGQPENTLAAFRHAIAAGVAVIEIDLRMTREQAIVVLHDARVDRTTNGHGPVAGMTLADLKLLTAGGGERVPTLAEALRLVRPTRTRLLLDLKKGGGVTVDAVVRAVREERAESHVLLGLRSIAEVRRARALAPQVAVLAWLPRLGDAPLYAAAGAAIVRLWSDWLDEGRAADAARIAETRRGGAAVWVLVGRRRPGSDDEWRRLHARLSAAGVDAIITDRPELIDP